MNITDKISFRERQILIHSYLYYHLNKNVISDAKYDKLSYRLVDMIKQYPKEFEESEYVECFRDFDGTTGFDLVDRLTQEQLVMIEVIANVLTRPNLYRDIN